MPANNLEYSIAQCRIKVRSAQEELERAGRYTLADDLLDVFEILPTFLSKLRRNDQEISSFRNEITSLGQRLASERQARVNAQQREQELREKIKQQEDTIKEHVAAIKTLDGRYQSLKIQVRQKYDEGYRAGQDYEKNRQKQPVSDSEDLIRSRLADGDKKFRAYNFKGALSTLREAQKIILSLPASRRPYFDNSDFRYQMAICGAYVNDLAASEACLSSFVEGSFPNSSSPTDMLHLAHAQHLLAQVYIGQNRILEAQDMWERSNTMRQAYLPSKHNCRSQSRALYARLLDLTGDENGARLARSNIEDRNVRESLKKAYSKLEPIPAGSDPKNESYELTDPATELLPIWTMWKKARQPGSSPDKPQPKDPNVVDPTKRSKWLDSLKLTNIGGKSLAELNPSLDQVIRSGDKQAVGRILKDSGVPPAPALHTAALFNEVSIATLLLDAKADPTEPCDGKTEDGEKLHGILPMHCAVGAQNEEMIRLLHSKGVDLLATKRLPERQRVCAPPLWLVSERWLKMTGKDDKESVLNILRLMRKCGWRTGDKINREERSMAYVVSKKLGKRPELQKAVLEYLRKN